MIGHIIILLLSSGIGYGLYKLVDKCSYKVYHIIYTLLFICMMYMCKLQMFNNIHPIFNHVLFWYSIAAWIWHLTKACFFIESTKEEENETN